MIGAEQPIEYYHIEIDRASRVEAEIITETPVSLTVNNDVWLTFMCTPVYLEAMAIGFLFNEGLIQSIDEVADVRLCASRDNIDVWLHRSIEKPEKWRRTSGCTGGITSVEEKLSPIEPSQTQLTNRTILNTQQIGRLIGELFESQDLYRKTGGVHTSALSDGHNIYAVAEDIGRHNTLDKIAGRCLLEKIDMTRLILLTTGRISSEMIQKAKRIGAAVVISRTSPSSLSIQLAKHWGITLIGYARRNRFNLYTHPERLSLQKFLDFDNQTQNIPNQTLQS